MQTQTDRERERVEVRERKKANAIPASLSHFLASRPLLPVLHYSHVNTPLAPPRWHAAQLLRPSPSLVLLTLLWTGETAVLRHTALALQICVSGQQWERWWWERRDLGTPRNLTVTSCSSLRRRLARSETLQARYCDESARLWRSHCVTLSTWETARLCCFTYTYRQTDKYRS